MELTIPYYYFDSGSFATDLLTGNSKQSEKIDSSRKIRCRLCGEIITDIQQSVNYNGDHVHHGTNPDGYYFRFACYKEASGCVAVGEASYKHSWFKGYSWQIVICNVCGEHLGWLFSGETRFYGLVIDKLVDEDSSLN